MARSGSRRRWFVGRRLAWVGGALVVLLLPVLFPKVRQPALIEIAAADASGNLLTNPRFEDVSGGVPAGWVLDPNLRPKGDLRVVPENGERVLQLSPTGKNTDKNKPYGIGQVVPAGGLAGKRLRAHASLRITPGANAFLLVFALSKDGKPLGNVAFTRLDASPDLRNQSGELTVDRNAATILFACTVTGTSGTASFADLFLGEDAASTAITPGAAQQPSALSASIRIDASKSLKEVPRGVFGTNVEWVRDGNGLWDAKKDTLNETVVQRARALNTTLVRYPGGGYADYFNWRESIGPRSARPLKPHILDPEKSKLLFGLHEFMSLCRAIGAEPLITVNVVANNAEEAAAWVAYANQPTHPDRARNGSPAPFDILLWEIGNEQYIKAQDPAAPTGASYVPTAEYIRRFRDYARAMKRVDPRIRVGALGGKNFGRMRLIGDEHWEADVLRQAGDAIDFIAVHNGYAPLVFGNDDASAFNDVYRALLAYPQLVAENLADINREIETDAAPHASRIKIAVTEWGPLFAYDMRNRWIDHSKTLGSGLFAASLLQTWLRAERVEIANFFKLTENGFMGWIGADGEPKPSYYALQMYRQHFGTRLVQTSTDVPTYDSRAIGLVDSVQKVPYLDAVSSLSADGATLSLIVVNKNLDAAIDTTVDLAGFNAAVPARAWTLTAPSLDANNGKDLPGFALLWAKQAGAPRNPMFEAGRAGTVVPLETSIAVGATGFHYRFAPRSVTAIELRRGR
jgi:alpha-N-arabinofuranosidase